MISAQAAKPVNYYSRDISSIEYDVDYAIGIAKNYLGFIPTLGLLIDGLNICELGPGINFGPQLILASHGASLTVVDRFLAPWDDNYHPQFYQALLRKWDGPNKVLQAVVESNSYSGLINTLEVPAEKICGSQFDLVISNAVLEHVYDAETVCKSLSKITRAGGYNSHQIDFRDHRDFTKPHEFLLMDENQFSEEAGVKNLQFGNRVRKSEWTSMFQKYGFEIIRVHNDQPVELDYLTDFLPKLRSSVSKYKNVDNEDLKYIGAQLIIKKF
jgi:hypothetical protein